MSFVVLDTDIASGAFRGNLPGRLRAQLASRTACIAFVTLGELTKWTAVRSWGPQRRSQLEQWRRRLVLLPFDEQVAVIWGELQARAQQRHLNRPSSAGSSRSSRSPTPLTLPSAVDPPTGQRGDAGTAIAYRQ